MSNRILSFLGLSLILFICFNQAHSQPSLSYVSWMYRGSSQMNNSVYKWNIYDTLNLVCLATGVNTAGAFVFAITKNAAPTSMTLQSGSSIKYTGMTGGSLIWSDIEGIQPGFENFVIIGTNYFANPYVNSVLHFDRRFLNVGVLMTTDTGTYHCTVAVLTSTSSTPVITSGALKITISTKPKQAYSTRASTNAYLTYSAALMSAYKLVF